MAMQQKSRGTPAKTWHWFKRLRGQFVRSCDDRPIAPLRPGASWGVTGNPSKVSCKRCAKLINAGSRSVKVELTPLEVETLLYIADGSNRLTQRGLALWCIAAKIRTKIAPKATNN